MLATFSNSVPRCPLVKNVLSSCNEYYDAQTMLTLNILDLSPKLVSKRNSHSLLDNSPMSKAVASNGAWSLSFEDAMNETDNLFSQGNLKIFEGCTRTIEGVIRSIHLITGRFS